MSCTICRSLCGVLVLLFVTITANGAEQPIYYYANTEVAKNISGSKTIHMTIDSVIVNTGVFKRKGVGYNGASPGPTLYWNEGEEIVIHVKNNLSVQSSVHWHGMIVPTDMDGVPGFSFDGIAPGETYVYRFPVLQAGTYWFHSHNPFQGPDGAYGSIIIHSKNPVPFKYNREYVIQVTDAHPDVGKKIMRNLKISGDFYNEQHPTVKGFFKQIKETGLRAAVRERMAWGGMRMMQSDVEDVQGFTPLINGKSSLQNWTGTFKPGERIRLRIINSSAQTLFDIRVPGLKMTVIEADGNLVLPVSVDELRIAVAETYDVIVHPKEDRAYSIIAESMGRTGLVRATMMPEGRQDLIAEKAPALRESPRLTFGDMALAMGHGAMTGMDHGAMVDMKHGEEEADTHGEMKRAEETDTGMAGMDHSKHAGMAVMNHGAGDAMPDPFYAPGSGLTPKAHNDGKFLSYADLKAFKPLYTERPPTREILLRLTGNMERFSWSINDTKYADAEVLRLKYGERVRFKFVNETMMTHPMHLHGMWSILDVGAGEWNPAKHVVSIAPSTTVFFETEVDAPGTWAFHCHLAYHAAGGMFRKVIVEGAPPVEVKTVNGEAADEHKYGA